MAKMVNKSARVVSETDFGVYVWLTDKGLPASSGNDVMCIQAVRGDQSAIDKITAAAKHYGIDEGGRVSFIEGARPVSEEEYQTQVQRMEAGLEPDPLNPVEASRLAREMGIEFKP